MDYLEYENISAHATNRDLSVYLMCDMCQMLFPTYGFGNFLKMKAAVDAHLEKTHNCIPKE